ncbi:MULTISPECIES: hypothetical protein [unclassified Pseudoalteromonas]|uniref:hypothetical protein n=1 Tax=Pseudoalteromonas TaxID=53246 RepID=UPI0019D0EF4B|nr:MULTISPECIES: hypothetical protein [unclassified Pseudoalteromonas]MBR8845424.1 hypothetical protein [Pseudoalteromonas sp. JC3]MCF2825621.1 hypothetical protein [Pseudoalteromonas sp. OF5H-5]MCF2831812.1 hypothetical protein [Pseudoalteromonas sp. DL2-H6]MCF2927636.1 hypothetical protein [Pseudoalteromonas sp. DL2-H1]MCG7552024.1 hypothetical protein [Pseudoalteromonas sp. Of11M-6]
MHQLLAPKNLTAYLARLRFSIGQFWQSLTLAQRYYLVSFIIFMFSLSETEDDNFTAFLILITTVTALCYEFWPRIMTFWESVPGKALILLFYAFIANFVLVQADGRINDLTGVSTDNFPYTHNLSVLLSLPTWFFITSTFLLILAQLFMTCYVVVLFLLKPLRIKPFWHQNHYRYPATTAIIRLIMCFVLLAFLVLGIAKSGASTAFTEFSSDFKIDEDGISFHANAKESRLADSEEENEGSSETQPQVADMSGGTPQQDETQSTADEPESLTVSINNDSNPDLHEQGKNYNDVLNQILAYFIFRFESDGNSRCEHSEGSNIVELNDYEILEIMPDNAAEYGYTYTVKPCISAAIGHQFKPQQP